MFQPSPSGYAAGMGQKQRERAQRRPDRQHPSPASMTFPRGNGEINERDFARSKEQLERVLGS
jgi:hypothetical protein